MNPVVKRTVLVLSLLAAGAAALWYVSRPEPVLVTVYTVAPGRVEQTVANTRVGTVKACRRAYLAPATGGQLATLNISEGSAVSQGQLLMEIWNDDLKAQVRLEQAETSVQRARARQTCSLAELAGREAQRQLKLRQVRQIVSEQQVDTAVTEAKAKRADCEAAHNAVVAGVARADAAAAALERTRVYAPFDGVVAEVNVELGEFVTPSPPGIPTLPAIDLLDISCLYVSAPIDEVDAPAVHPGMRACVSLDAFPRRRCSGTISRVAPYVLDQEKQARTVEVEVKLTQPEDLAGLLPGYSADIEVSLAVRESTLRLPTEAVLEENRVLLYGGDGYLEERRFEPGIANWEYTEIRSGLAAGERVVVSVGREGVTAGAYAKPETGPEG